MNGAIFRHDMSPAATRLGNLLGEAEALLPRYLEATEGLVHEKKGIRRSELFFFYALVAGLNPVRIIRIGPGARPKHAGSGATLPGGFNR